MQYCCQSPRVVENAVLALVMCVVSRYPEASLHNCMALKMSKQRVAWVQKNGKIPGNASSR